MYKRQGLLLSELSGLYTQNQPELGWTNAGIYAPTIRYHEGRYYMVTTIFPSRRHFYVWTDDPSKEWSDPVFIDFAIGSCDPTLFWDEGKCYFLWKAAADETRPGIKPGEINICEIDVHTGRRTGDVHHLGTGLGGRYPEGPHIYKKDDYYYMMLAEGGTEHGHHVNILRSRSLFGPYEPNPANPILTHFSMNVPKGTEIGSHMSLASQRLQEPAKIRVNECEYTKNWKIVFADVCIFYF